MNTDAIERWAESVGITPRVGGGLVEHVVHEVTHAVLLGLSLTDGELSQRIDEAITEREDGWN